MVTLIGGKNRENKQQTLWEKLQDNNSIKEVQAYIKAVNTIKGKYS